MTIALKVLRGLIAMIILVGIMQPVPAAAEVRLDSVLGIPWGVSPEEARKIMTGNGYSFVWEGNDAATGSKVLEFKGPYAALPAYHSLYFMNSQLWQLHVRISDEEIGLDYAFDSLNKLLIEKYGPKSRDESYNMPVSSLPKPVLVTKYIWNLDGDSKRINLIKLRTFHVDKIKMDGGAIVKYENIQLFETLKKKNI